MIVVGIVVAAVADEMLLAHPTGHPEPALAVSALGGSALFLGGTMVFKRLSSLRPWMPFSHAVGLALLGGAAILSWLLHWPPLAVGGATVSILLLVCVWEWGSYHGGWAARGIHAPGPLRRRGERKIAEWEARKRDAQLHSGEDKR